MNTIGLNDGFLILRDKDNNIGAALDLRDVMWMSCSHPENKLNMVMAGPGPEHTICCGWRHNHCIGTAVASGIGTREDRSGKNQGFLTSHGRFVDREEAFQIAQAAGQLTSHIHFPGSLCSEDLYLQRSST